MEYRILGPLEVACDGNPLDLGGRKQRSLLALLVINANRVVTTERILEELWGDKAGARRMPFGCTSRGSGRSWSPIATSRPCWSPEITGIAS